jgi:hypothetical protein
VFDDALVDPETGVRYSPTTRRRLDAGADAPTGGDELPDDEPRAEVPTTAVRTPEVVGVGASAERA